ncbi:hypothetical protein COOONC_06490 [Cooperia oncophora]
MEGRYLKTSQVYKKRGAFIFVELVSTCRVLTNLVIDSRHVMSMISSISSEQLLRTPSCSGDPQEQMDLDECRAEAGIATIAVKCDSELAKTMRTDDPKRDSVVAAVNEQSALVKEIVRTILKEMRDFCGPRIADGIINLLRTANISEAEQMKQLFSDFDDMKSIVESLRKRVEDLGDNSLRAASSQGENDGPVVAQQRNLSHRPGCDRPKDPQGLCRTKTQGTKPEYDLHRTQARTKFLDFL